jgi:hypothetical protein
MRALFQCATFSGTASHVEAETGPSLSLSDGDSSDL